uniref:Uncharacterized protein n=1 Tax=Brassica oleracea var. oleracea TaxID=109376 RepID=A0A0D3D6S9_BRAOL
MHVQKWWKENFGFELDGFGEVDDAEGLFQDAKEKAIERLFGDLDQSFRFISKLMSELHSSNGLLVDWQYDSVVICLLQTLFHQTGFSVILSDHLTTDHT